MPLVCTSVIPVHSFVTSFLLTLIFVLILVATSTIYTPLLITMFDL